jgi:hypothetical protein
VLKTNQAFQITGHAAGTAAFRCIQSSCNRWPLLAVPIDLSLPQAAATAGRFGHLQLFDEAVSCACTAGGRIDPVMV